MNNEKSHGVGGYDWINRTPRTDRHRLSQIGQDGDRRKDVRSVRPKGGVFEARKNSPTRQSGPTLDQVFDLNVLSVADEVAKTVIRKQKDYGPNNIRKSPFGPLIGLTIRLYDKIARLAHLSKGQEPENESLRDTFIDIAGYGLIGLMILDGTFPDTKE